MKSNCDQDSQLSKQIVQWYIKNGRSNLPWRKNVTAYRVWISEIMLQQTQVKTVIPFFKKFIARYPNLKSLSSANEEEILALWTGLGFYRRAINIYNSKEIILNDFKNRFESSGLHIDLIKPEKFLKTSEIIKHGIIKSDMIISVSK